MANPVSVPNTFVAATDAVAAEVNANFDSLVNYINNNMVHDDGTVSITGTQTVNNLIVQGTLTAEGNLNVDGDIKGDVIANNGTSIVLDNGTNGSNAWFKGDVRNASGSTIVDVSTAQFNGNASTSSSTSGNAATATKLAQQMTINLGQDLSGSIVFDGDEGTVNANISVVNGSHTHDNRYYTESESDGRFLGINAKAADSHELDGLGSEKFLRSDQDDTSTGRLTISRTNVGTAGNQALNIACATNSQPTAGISFQYGTGGTVVNHGIFRMSNTSMHRFVFLQENNASLADIGFQAAHCSSVTASSFVQAPTIYRNSEQTISDESLKNNVGSALGLSFVNRLAPFTGTWIDSDEYGTDQHQFLSVQMVETALTEEGFDPAACGMVSTNPVTDDRTMSYSELVPVLVQAVNDLTARLEAVEAA